MKARIVSLSEAYDMAYEISHQILQSGGQFDVVVGISRGGLPPSRIICDFLNIKTLTSIQIRHYESGGKTRDELMISDPVNINLQNKHVLIADDVNDSGKSLKAAYENIKGLKPAGLKTAVLHEKSTTSFKADYTGSVLSEWKWLIYQWAVTEDLIEFLDREKMLDAGEEDAIRHLEEQYDLTVDRGLLKKVLSMKENYTER
ncbi:MAG: phosphoribosyltransferase [Balneolaceae bacterium]